MQGATVAVLLVHQPPQVLWVEDLPPSQEISASLSVPPSVGSHLAVPGALVVCKAHPECILGSLV